MKGGAAHRDLSVMGTTARREIMRQSVMRKLRVWRRQHGPDLVAEVAPIQGMGTWRACARRLRSTGRHELVDHAKRSFSLLADAQAAADELLQQHYKHRCGHACGEWGPVQSIRAGDRELNPERTLS
jgi:hypothetical protein